MSAVIEAKRAALYNRHGCFVKMMSVSPHITAITSDGLMYLLQSELAGVLRFHEQQPEDLIQTPKDTLTPGDVRFLRSLRIEPWNGPDE